MSSDRTRIYTQGWFASATEPSNSTSIYLGGWFVTSGGTPTAPQDLTAAALTFTDVLLTWVDNSSIEDGFRVERSSDGGSTWSELGSTGPNVENFTDSGAIPGVTYDYRVIAFNTTGDSSPVEISSFTIPIPGTISLTAPPGPPVEEERNTLEPLEVSFLSPSVYGVELNPDGSLTGYKY